MKRIRLVILFSVALAIASAMFCVASPYPVPSAQAQDPIIATAQQAIRQRQYELGLTATADRAIVLTQQAERQATAFALSVKQAEDARVANLTSTARADATKEAQATATRVAGQTATAVTSATQAAAGTATATAQMATVAAVQSERTATAVAIQTADAIAYQATIDANNVANRQQLVNQSLQAVRVLGYFVLTATGAALCVLMWRSVSLIRPRKPVVVVASAAGEREPEPPMEDGEGADITNDPRASAYIIDLLKQQGVAQ